MGMMHVEWSVMVQFYFPHGRWLDLGIVDGKASMLFVPWLSSIVLHMSSVVRKDKDNVFQFNPVVAMSL